MTTEKTTATQAGHNKVHRANAAALAGWFVVLVCSLLIYDALLFSSLSREVWSDVQACHCNRLISTKA